MDILFPQHPPYRSKHSTALGVNKAIQNNNDNILQHAVKTSERERERERESKQNKTYFKKYIKIIFFNEEEEERMYWSDIYISDQYDGG